MPLEINKELSILSLLEKWLIQIGVDPAFASWLKGVIIVATILFISIILLKLTQLFIKYFIGNIIKKTSFTWDDILMEKKVFHRLAFLVPIFFIHSIAPLALKDYPFWIIFSQKALKIAMVLLVLLVSGSFAHSFIDHAKAEKPDKVFAITQYLNLGRIVLWSFGIVIIISTLMGMNPLAFLGGLTAFMAVLVLVFKDPLLGLTASIQIVTQNLIRIGDWVTLSKGDVDGVVKEINLVSVKIENWDKTISFVPTYSFISDTFQNWRGMEESGVRRIKRSVFININSVKFCTDEMLEKYKKIYLIKTIIEKTQQEIVEFNEKLGINKEHKELAINGKNQTNLGIFRKYLAEFLKHNANIAQHNTLLVRQLQPTEKGLPVEIYIFSNVQEWAKYEDVQSDIFDHILAAVPMFDLQVFQNPTGADFRNLAGS